MIIVSVPILVTDLMAIGEYLNIWWIFIFIITLLNKEYYCVYIDKWKWQPCCR